MTLARRARSTARAVAPLARARLACATSDAPVGSGVASRACSPRGADAGDPEGTGCGGAAVAGGVGLTATGAAALSSGGAAPRMGTQTTSPQTVHPQGGRAA